MRRSRKQRPRSSAWSGRDPLPIPCWGMIMARPEGGIAVALTKYRVEGMTCGHCVAAVTAELRELPGVEDVKVDLVL
jgi:hypothetical protein